MKHVLVIITQLQSNSLNLAFMALAIAGNWIDHWIYFPTLVSAAVILGIIRYVHDRKWLKDTVEYLRIVRNLSVWKVALAIILIPLVVLLLSHYDLLDFIELNDNTTFYLLIVSVISTSSDSLPIFVDSIKTFEDGLQLPGRKGALIPWKDIHAMELNEHFVISAHQEYTFHLDEKDLNRARSVIDFWQKRSGRLRFN